MSNTILVQYKFRMRYAVVLALGRVSALNSVLLGASNELGEFESGLTAGWFGLIPELVFGGVATLAVTGLCALGFRVLSRIDRFSHAARAIAVVDGAGLQTSPRAQSQSK